MTATAASTPGGPSAWREALALVLLGAFLFALRLAGPADLTDNDQERPASYVLDAVQNGHWAIQRDAYDDLASKPPMLTWLAGAATALAGRISRLTLYLPSAAAMVGAALLIWTAGRTHFGRLAGWLGALALLFSPYGFKHVVLARNDALFAFTVTLAALGAYRAWTTGRDWSRFGLAAAAATLTKGPLGVLLAVAGLAALRREPRDATARPAGGAAAGATALWLAVVGGWFALAWLEAGQDLIHKQLGRELAGHLTGAEAGGKGLFADPLHPLLYFLSRFAPWSLAAGVGLVRVVRRPAATAEARRFERFLFGWFVAGLLVFTAAPHKRPDLLLPLIPAAALLAGRELAGVLQRFGEVRLWPASLVGACGLLVALGVLRPQGRDTAAEILPTRASQAMAAWWEAEGPRAIPLTFVEHTLTVQFYLNRHQLVCDAAQAARLLAGDAACVVVTRDLAAVQRHLPPGVEPVLLHAEPAGASPRIWALGHPAVRAGPPLATAVAVGGLRLRLEQAALVACYRRDFEVRRLADGARVEIGNESGRPLVAGIRWQGAPGAAWTRRTLVPGEVWRVEGP